MKWFRSLFKSSPNRTNEKHGPLSSFWGVKKISECGLMHSEKQKGFLFEAEGMDGSFLTKDQLQFLHQNWRSILQLQTDDEMQIIFRKRVDFVEWVEKQLKASFLSENTYGRRILLDHLADQVQQMSSKPPKLISQKILICYWSSEDMDEGALKEKRSLVRAQLESFGFPIKVLNKSQIEKEIHVSSQDLSASVQQLPEWPHLNINADQVQINEDIYRSLELKKLPENYTELGMIHAITALPFPLDLCVRLKARDTKPVITKLERKRNLLMAQLSSKRTTAPEIETQIRQINDILRNLAERAETIFDMKFTVGLRYPKEYSNFQRRALSSIFRAANKMDFCELEESTLGTFDNYLECIPTFKGENIHTHTMLSSNMIHFLPFFCHSKGDPRAVVSFQTKNSGLFGIDPTNPRLANYNWLVSGTSGSGKSFFVNSLLAQSSSINPNIFIIDIGGSYNKLTQFLGGRVLSLETSSGFKISPFFLPKNHDSNEEGIRRQHIFQIFLEMCRVDGKLPNIELRHLLNESLEELFELEELPLKPITYLIDELRKSSNPLARHLIMLLEPWGLNGFFAQFLDNNIPIISEDRIVTFDLKGLTDFEDLSRVVQLIVCSSLWARIRQTKQSKFSWIVLDEVAFSLLKSQPQFVDELVSTLRKYFAGAVVVVQDLEKVTSSLAASSILQNTHSKAILQQRGNPKNYSEVLNLNQVDQWAIESLNRKKGSFSDIFLIRDKEKTVVRHVPSQLEYWLATTAPEDKIALKKWMNNSHENSFQKKILEFTSNNSSYLMTLALILFLGLSFNNKAEAIVPLPSNAFQMQQLIDNSTKQIESLKQILKQSKTNSSDLNKASKALNNLSLDIDKSIVQYQGTDVYEKALLKIQNKDDYKNTFSDSSQVKQKLPIHGNDEVTLSIEENFKDRVNFQRKTVKANENDLINQNRLRQVLTESGPGFVPKIHAEAVIGSWQSNTRLSMQMSELLSDLRAIREEIRLSRMQKENENPLSFLIKGAEMQNAKMRDKP